MTEPAAGAKVLAVAVGFELDPEPALAVILDPTLVVKLCTA